MASLANGLYAASTSTVSINFFGTVQITQPLNQTFISANTNTAIKLVSLPASSIFPVVLDCFISGTFSKYQNITSNSANSQSFGIPANFYGNCTFIVNVRGTNFITPNSVRVTVTQNTWFLKPYPQSTYVVHSIIELIVASSYNTSDLIMINQNCNGSTKTYTGVNVYSTIYAQIPANYLGSCTFWTLANGMYRAAPPVTISIVPSLQVMFVAPVNSTFIAAGTSLGVKLTSSSISENFNVQLDCKIPGVQPSVQSIASNTPSTVPFAIPLDFYGVGCFLSVIDSTNYIKINTVNIAVTQPTYFRDPKLAGSYLINSSLPVLISSPVQVLNNFTIVQKCGTGMSNITNVGLNYTYQIPAIRNFTGTCSLSTLVNSFYRASSVSFYVVQGTVTIASPTNLASVAAGTSLKAVLSSAPFSMNFTVQLDCSIPNVLPLITIIMSNSKQWYGFNIPSNYYGTNCILSVTNLPDNFIAQNTISLIVTQPVTITSPKSSQTFLSNGSVPILLSSPINTLDVFTLIQNCSNNTTVFPNLLLNTTFEAALPASYSGPCSFVTLRNGFYLASNAVTVSIVPSPVVIFVSPTNNTYYRSGNMASVWLSSTENAANFTVQLSNSNPNSPTKNATIPSNVQPANNFAIPADFYAYCLFQIANPVSPFTAENTVTIFVLQAVWFTLPLSGSCSVTNSTIPVLLASKIITSDSLVVFQKCGNSTLNYTGILVNETFNAQLPETYVGSCIFSIQPSGIYYASGTSTVNVVSSPLVKFAAPANLTFVSAGSSLGVKLFSTTTSVFKVQLNCGVSGTSVQNITSNTVATVAFHVPPNFYGMNCNLTVIDSTEMIPANYVTVTITQSLTFVSPTKSSSQLINSQVTLLLNSSVPSPNNFTVYQTCNNTQAIFDNVYLGVVYNALLPTGYIGSCTYLVPATGYYRSTSVSFNVVQGTVSFTFPSNQSYIAAGTTQRVILVSGPVANNFTVQLNCPIAGLTPITISVRSNSNLWYQIFIPSNYYGNCTLSVINLPDNFIAQNTISLIVTQRVIITSPKSSQTFLSNGSVPILLSSPINTLDVFTLIQNCSNNTTVFPNLLLNTTFEAALPASYSGPCSFVTLRNGFYLASNAVTVSIVPSPVVIFVSPTNNTYYRSGNMASVWLSSTENAANFTVQLSNSNPNSPTKNATIPSNVQPANNFAIPADFYAYCLFQIANPVSPFTAENTVTIFVLQAVWFTLPLSGSCSVTNSTIPVLLASKIITSDSLVVFQKCGNSTLNYTGILVNETFNAQLPETYVGSCIFSIQPSGIYYASGTSTVNVVSSPLVKFAAPANLTFVSAGSSLGVKLFSTTTSVFKVQLNCGVSGTSVQNITSNTVATVAFHVPPNFYGMNCNLTVIDSTEMIPANYVTVTITQSLTFVSPTKSSSQLINSQVTLLLNSSVPSPNNFTVYQTCNNTQAIFDNVYLGVVYNALLPTGYIGSCTYLVPATGYYRSTSVSFNVVQGTVSFTLPINGTLVVSGTNLNVKLSSTVKAANFTVMLNCFMPSIQPFNSTVLSNTSGNVLFPVPSNFSGNNCSLTVISPLESFIPTNSAFIEVIEFFT